GAASDHDLETLEQFEKVPGTGHRGQGRPTGRGVGAVVVELPATILLRPAGEHKRDIGHCLAVPPPVLGAG
ncbi:MAG: hypothetical protein ACRDX8_14075, partial [Acidimicrobiales bacterium]